MHSSTTSLVACALSACLLAAGAATVSAAPRSASACAAFAPQPGDAKATAEETGVLGGRPARTAYLPGGAWRTTTCDESGRPRRQVTMAPQRLPDGRVADLPVAVVERVGDRVVHSSALRGDLRLLGGRWRATVAQARAAGLAPLDPAAVTNDALPPRYDEAGVRAVARTLDGAVASRRGGIRFTRGSATPTTREARQRARAAARARGGSAPTARAAVTGDKCTLGSYSASGSKLGAGYGYYVNWSAIGAVYHADFTTQTIYGFHSWQFGYNDCGWSQAEIVGTANFGTTTQSAASADGGTAIWHGGTHVVDAGALTAGGCAGAIACTWRWTDTTGATILESNVRLNSALPWTIGWQPGFYDIWSIVTHEGGHAIPGLNDLYAASDYWAAMYGYGYTNDATKRLLALGEYNYVNWLY